MDNLTHSFMGVMLSRAGLNRLTPHATPLLLLAANIPDVDLVALTGGPENYFHHHRGLTHSLIMTPLMAAVAVVFVWPFVRKSLRILPALAVALAGVLSHLLLDWTNHYGIRLLLPWSGEWLKLGTTGLFDGWIWLAMALALAGPAISRLVSSEIGAQRSSGRGAAIFALLFVLFYDGGRYVLCRRAIAAQESRLFEGASPRRVTLIPSRMNPFHWIGIVDTGPAFYVSTVDLLQEFDPTAARVLYKPEQIPSVDALRSTPPFRDLLGFTDFAYWRVEPSPERGNKTRVDAMDLRFGVPPDEAFIASAVLNEARQIERAWFHYTAEPQH